MITAGVLVVSAALATALPARTVVGGIHLYQRDLSPIVAALGGRCRFTPTCSRYAEVVIQRDGVARGGWKALKRIARCGPWTPRGTMDPP